ncbi:MAG: thiol-disulfide oxidoreductase [Proteobacteria bacterium]|nr:thiol-disulfide oxidoreductase [Pseudomonadota bacterium]MBS1246071.1 thiol-disulfide oxidoreductase [Pseudomonadota bacterium]
MTRRRILAAVLGLFMTVIAWAGAPSIPLQDLDGRARNVNEFIGHDKWVIVVTWSHDCHICDLEIHEMAALHAARHDNDAIVLGITLDGAEYLKEARAFVKRHKLPFVNLITEPSQEVMMKFGAGKFVGTPTYYIYDPKGEIVGQNIGPLTRAEVEEFISSFDKAPQNDK